MKINDTLPIPIGTQIRITSDDLAEDEPIRHAIEQKYENVLDVRIQHGCAYIAIGESGKVKSANYNITKRLFEWILKEWKDPLSVDEITIGVTYLKYRGDSRPSRHLTLDIVTPKGDINGTQTQTKEPQCPAEPQA